MSQEDATSILQVDILIQSKSNSVERHLEQNAYFCSSIAKNLYHQTKLERVHENNSQHQVTQ